MERNIWIIIIVFVALFQGCTKEEVEFSYPESKIWAHKVNDIETARKKSKVFDGFEVDVIYSTYQDKLFVCHNLEDTINNLVLEEWFNAIEKPASKFFWLDMKYIDVDNAERTSKRINEIMTVHKMKNNVFVESSNTKALHIVKENGLKVIYWTPNPIWDNIDTATWLDKTRKNIQDLCPDAISNEARLLGLFSEYFPEQNLHLWNTPNEYSIEDAERTCEICRNKSVRVVLVDYDEPISCD